ncbi:hypothetical protein BDQ17DRAFT_1422736 [Cyathus striatus]|nr:hypothetical protein BDQ17DRAFT_1422736 [Cyathus striatus]
MPTSTSTPPTSPYDTAIHLLTALSSPTPMPSLPDVAANITHMATTNPDAGSRMITLVADILRELDNMGEQGEEMKMEFEDELADRAIAGFIDFWNDDHKDPLLEDDEDALEEQPHPLLLSSYLGDLFSLGLIPLDLHEDCIEYLIENVRSGEDLLALYMLISRSTRKHTQENMSGSTKSLKSDSGHSDRIPPKLDPLFLGNCFLCIQRICDRLQGEGDKHYSPWGDLVNPQLILQHIGELFQLCDRKLRFPDILPPPKYTGFLKEEEIRRGRGRDRYYSV